MRLPLVLAGIIGVSRATSQPAAGYLFQEARHDVEAASIPRQAARLLVQQRLGADSRSQIKEIAGLASHEAALDLLNTFGKPSSLFDSSTERPSQLVILIEGVSLDEVKGGISNAGRAFEVSDPPSSVAHGKLVQELGWAGVHQNTCDFERAINPLDDACWGSSQASVARFDAQKDGAILASLKAAAPKLERLAKSGEMETLVLLLPESSRKSNLNTWSTHEQKLSRRQTEAVLSAVDTPTTQDVNSVDDATFVRQTSDSNTGYPVWPPQLLQKIPACFQTLNACMTATKDCSGHGVCQNKYAPPSEDDDDTKKRDEKDTPPQACFTCKCLRTYEGTEKGSTIAWGGKACERIDVSVPFALFTGLGIMLVVFLIGALSMLFTLGGEPLPGILGAGVSRK